MSLTFDVSAGDTMNPLNDHELLLWAMRAGLTRDEVRPGRCAVAGHIPWLRPGETQTQCINWDMEAVPVVEGVGGIAAGTFAVADGAG